MFTSWTFLFFFSLLSIFRAFLKSKCSKKHLDFLKKKNGEFKFDVIGLDLVFMLF